MIRTEVFGLEPLCPECEGADESEGDSERRRTTDRVHSSIFRGFQRPHGCGEGLLQVASSIAFLSFPVNSIAFVIDSTSHFTSPGETTISKPPFSLTNTPTATLERVLI